MVYNKSTVAFVFSVASALAQPLEFNRDVRPIFSDRCLTCHGQDAANKGIRLRLDREESAKSDLGGGKRAIVPGKPEESLLLQRLQTPNKALRMPPAHTGSTVSASEIATLERWIRDGAVWQKHWSFIPPQKAAVPAGVLHFPGHVDRDRRPVLHHPLEALQRSTVALLPVPAYQRFFRPEVSLSQGVFLMMFPRPLTAAAAVTIADNVETLNVFRAPPVPHVSITVPESCSTPTIVACRRIALAPPTSSSTLAPRSWPP